MTPPPLIYLCGADVHRSLPMRDAIEAMREAFLQLHAGSVEMPARGHMDLPEQNGTLLLMPCYSRQSLRMTVKLVSLYEDNARLDLPFIHSTLLLADAGTGVPLAILDGAVLTAIRTAAVCGVATQQLAVQEASTAAIFGAGVQARSQLAAMCAVCPIQRARVFDVHADAAAAFASEMSDKLGIDVERADNSADALHGAQVVCTVTTSHTPVFEDTQISPGTHINAVGSYKPHVVEVPAETVQRAHVIVDQREAALEEAGDLLSPIRDGLIAADHIRGELGELLAGTVKGRSDDNQITLFKSVGLAMQDLFAAVRAYENARELGLGQELNR